MKHDLLEEPTKTSLRLTTNEKQNVYASKKFNDEEQKKLLTFNHNRALKREINLRLERKHEYDNRLIAIEEEIRSLNDKKIYLNECIKTLENDNYILQEQIINK